MNNNLRRAMQPIAAATLLLMTSSVHAEESTGLFIRIDNDIFTGSDRDYTSGVQVGSTSATVESFDDLALAPSIRWANDKLRWLQPKGFDENNVTWTIGQRMYTPEDWSRSKPDPLDR